MGNGIRRTGEVRMMITEEMITKDEKRWNDRNIIAELGYCGMNILHRKNITNDDIRFYAYIMRKAHAMLKDQEAVPVVQREIAHLLFWCCGSCGVAITDGDKFCRMCGRPVKWNE